MGAKIVAIVDDDPAVLDALRMTFVQFGWKVVAGKSYEQIVEQIKDIRRISPTFFPEAFVV